ncbi:MAG: ABC transporter permease [Treponema sp.]|jgi:ribose transport system permease protein|nr:ABC transporter permease [Treponema sp.]
MITIKANAVLTKYGAGIVLFFMVIINAFITPNFVHINTLWNILLQSFPVMMIAIGMTFVIATGGIDISVGSTMALSSIVLAKFLIFNNASFGVSLALALGAALIFGLFNGVLVGVFKFQPIVATLILMISGRGIAQLFNDGVVISFYGDTYSAIGLYRIAGIIPVQVVIIAVTAIIALFILKRTTFGCYIQAVGDNIQASHLAGINTVGVLISVYIISALLAGLAASFETMRMLSADPNNIGKAIELDCIAAVAVGGASMSGGRAKIIGTITGTLIMQLITTMVNMNNVPYAFSLVIKSAIIVFALYLQKDAL